MVHHNLATSVPAFPSQSTQQVAETSELFFPKSEPTDEVLSGIELFLSKLKLSDVEVSEVLRELSEVLEEEEEDLEESTMTNASPACAQLDKRRRSSLQRGESRLAAWSSPNTARKSTPWPEERSELREMSTLRAPV